MILRSKGTATNAGDFFAWEEYSPEPLRTCVEQWKEPPPVLLAIN